MLQIAENIEIAAMIVGLSFRLRIVWLMYPPTKIAVLYFLTALIDFIELEKKEESKRIKDQVSKETHALSESFSTCVVNTRKSL